MRPRKMATKAVIAAVVRRVATAKAAFRLTLSAANRQQLYIPPWCAHGFCVVSDEAEVIYKTTTEYAPEHEEGIRWDDPSIGIKWPIAEVMLSDRDRRWPGLDT